MGRSRETPRGPDAFACQLLEPRPCHGQGFSRWILTGSQTGLNSEVQWLIGCFFPSFSLLPPILLSFHPSRHMSLGSWGMLCGYHYWTGQALTLPSWGLQNRENSEEEPKRERGTVCQRTVLLISYYFLSILFSFHLHGLSNLILTKILQKSISFIFQLRKFRIRGQ